MKFGLFSLMTIENNPGGAAGAIADTLELVKLADEVGFETAWFAEHHFIDFSGSCSPLMMAAYMAGRTKRIKVAPAVLVLPFYHPLRLAQEIAMLDCQTEGRAVIGIGSGYQKYESDRFGVDLAEKNPMTLECWTIVSRALIDGHVSFDGKYYKIPETVFAMRCVQKPLPQVFVTGIEPSIIKAAAQVNGVPIVTGGFRGTNAIYGAHEKTKLSWAAAGLDPATMPFAVQQYIHITDSRKEALEAAEFARKVGRTVAALKQPTIELDGTFIRKPPIADEPPIEEIVNMTVIGDPHHAAERIVEELRRVNPIHYSCYFQFGGMPLARARKSMERFVKEVIPLIEKELGPLDAIGQVKAPAVAH